MPLDYSFHLNSDSLLKFWGPVEHYNLSNDLYFTYLPDNIFHNIAIDFWHILHEGCVVCVSSFFPFFIKTVDSVMTMILLNVIDFHGC